ncbi:hypothetical protein YSY43_20270 [Paenibacillus sp. YSY-4.3]
MRAKTIAIIGAVVLTIGIGTAAYAAEAGPSAFRDMLPFMKEMHPNLNDSQLEQMYNSCHQREGNAASQGMHSYSSM